MTSSRAWLTCAFVTGAVVVLILVLKKPEAEADGPTAPKAPPPLTEQEVRTYIDIMPQVSQILRDIAMKYEIARRAGNVDADAFGAQAQAQVQALLERRHLTQDSWDKVQRRVEYAVNAIRARGEFEGQRADMEERKRMKEQLLDKLARDDERAQVQKEIDHINMLLEHGGPPLSDKDLELIGQYWKTLNEVAPSSGPPPKPKEEEPAPPRGK